MSDIPATHRGAPVRLHTIDGPRGVLLRCMAENGDRYWRIKLAARWMPAEHFILDGPGDRVVACAECRLPAIVPDGEGLCEPCRRHSAETIRPATQGRGTFPREE